MAIHETVLHDADFNVGSQTVFFVQLFGQTGAVIVAFCNQDWTREDQSLEPAEEVKSSRFATFPTRNPNEQIQKIITWELNWVAKRRLSAWMPQFESESLAFHLH